MKTLEQKEKIVKFMNYPKHEKDNEFYVGLSRYMPLEQLDFESNWNFLIDVIDKIESLKEGNFDVEIGKKGTTINDYSTKFEEKLIITNVTDVSFENKIEHAYDAVCKFIDWFNSQTFAFIENQSIYVTKNGETYLLFASTFDL